MSTANLININSKKYLSRHIKDYERITLITGVTGTTGSGILDILSKDPEVVSGKRLIVGIDNLFRGPLTNVQSHLYRDYFCLFIKDFRDLIKDYGRKYDKSTKFWIDKVDQIYHMAAIVQTRHFYDSPDMTYKVNCQGTIDLFDLFRKRNPLNISRKFVEGSSSEIYGHIDEKDLPAKETTKTVFDSVEDSTRWSYAEGKLLVEHYLDHYKDDIGVCHLRFANTYGERDLDPQHIIPYIIDGICKGKALHLNSRWSEYKRTFLNNKDSARACVEVMKKGKSGVAYNVGSEELVSIEELYYLIKDIISADYFEGTKDICCVVNDVSRPGDPLIRALDTTRLYQDTGFKPEVSLRDGIKEMFEAYCNQIYSNLTHLLKRL